MDVIQRHIIIDRIHHSLLHHLVVTTIRRIRRIATEEVEEVVDTVVVMPPQEVDLILQRASLPFLPPFMPLHRYH